MRKIDFELEIGWGLNYLNMRTHCECKDPVLIERDPSFSIMNCEQCGGYKTDWELFDEP